jgi:hypothetical protein
MHDVKLTIVPGRVRLDLELLLFLIVIGHVYKKGLAEFWDVF